MSKQQYEMRLAEIDAAIVAIDEEWGWLEVREAELGAMKWALLDDREAVEKSLARCRAPNNERIVP
jgi:hypothetical protein